MTGSEQLPLLRAWAEAGWIRRLDAAFARFLVEVCPDAAPPVVLAAALTAQVEGQGHACLPVDEFLHDARALLAWPGYTLKHWHRIFYAALNLAGLGKTLDRLREGETQQQRAQLAQQLKNGEMGETRLDGWPGICLE